MHLKTVLHPGWFYPEAVISKVVAESERIIKTSYRLPYGAKFLRSTIFVDWLPTSFCGNNFHGSQLLPSLIFIR